MLPFVLMPAVVVLITVMYLALCPESFVPRMPELATVRNSSRQAVSGRLNVFETVHAATRLHQTFGPRSSREARRVGRDPLRQHRAVVGRDARTPWYIRVRSLLALIVIIIGLGMAIAGAVLLVLASGRFLLEILAGN